MHKPMIVYKNWFVYIYKSNILEFEFNTVYEDSPSVNKVKRIDFELTYPQKDPDGSGFGQFATEQTLDIIDSIIEYEYPDYRSAMPNTASIGSFFGNIGNLMPASFRKTMQDYLANLEDSDTPANPSQANPTTLWIFCTSSATLFPSLLIMLRSVFILLSLVNKKYLVQRWHTINLL